MTARENPAAANDGASENTLEPGNPYEDSTANSTRTRMELGERAGKYLDSVCDAIASGRVDVWQLPLPIAALYLLGYAHGEKSPVSDLARANFEADYWYHRANNSVPWHRTAELELWRQGVAA